MILSKLDEQQRRDLIAQFVTPGWAVLKQEFRLRQQNMAKDLIYHSDRSKDTDRRAAIVAIDMLLDIEKEVFAPPPPPNPEEQPFSIPQPPSGNRY